MNLRARKALGCLGLLGYLGAYIALAVQIGSALQSVLPPWALALFYITAGVAWVLPLRPLFRWMTRP